MTPENPQIRNAVITAATLTNADHGCLSAWVMLDYGGGSGQGFGGFNLYSPGKVPRRSLAGHFIWRMLQVADVDDWTELVGRTVRARISFGKVDALGHIIKDDWFCPSEEFSEIIGGDR